jgi:hypothetical protein
MNGLHTHLLKISFTGTEKKYMEISNLKPKVVYELSCSQL